MRSSDGVEGSRSCGFDSLRPHHNFPISRPEKKATMPIPYEAVAYLHSPDAVGAGAGDNIPESVTE